MAKKKNRAKFPKRIAGVRIPKQFRRFADSPVGSNIVTAGVLYGVYNIANSDTAKQFVARVREEVARADSAMQRFADDRRTQREDFDESGYRSSAN